MRRRERSWRGSIGVGALAAMAVRTLAVPTASQAQTTDSIAPRSATVAWTYSTALVTNASGGLARGTVGLGAGGVELTVVPQRLLHWSGARLFVFVMGTHGGAPSALVGDIQQVNDLEAEPDVFLEEAWLQQNLLHDQLSILVGRYDINTEFYRLQSTALFANGAFGMGPEFAESGVGGPSSFPNTSVGARIGIMPWSNIVLRVAAMNAVPAERPDQPVQTFTGSDGGLLVAELSFVARPRADRIPRRRRFEVGLGLPRTYIGKVALGVWAYRGTFADLLDTQPGGLPVLHHGSRGAYLIGDRDIWSDRRDSSRVLAVFGQAGIGDERVQQVGGYFGAGLRLTAPIAGRHDDELGLGVATAVIGAQARRQGDADGEPAANETAIELTYLFQLTKTVSLQPDLQYVMHPGGTASARNAFVPSLRMSIGR